MMILNPIGEPMCEAPDWFPVEADRRRRAGMWTVAQFEQRWRPSEPGWVEIRPARTVAFRIVRDKTDRECVLLASVSDVAAFEQAARERSQSAHS